MKKINVYITLYCLLEILIMIVLLLRCLYPEYFVNWGWTLLVLAIVGCALWFSYAGRKITVRRGERVIRLSKMHTSISAIIVVIFACKLVELIDIPNSLLIITAGAYIGYVLTDYFVALRKISIRRR